MKLYAPSTIKEIEKSHGFRFSKNLGQNFLTDKGIIDQIIEGSLIQENDLVIEIGPGIGVLTAEAAQQAEKVVAVEIDQSLIPVLKDTLKEFDNITVINQDILKTDLTELVKQHRAGGGVKIIGNLPYYITTSIIMKILEDGVKADSITVMMQKEVADRIKAAPGSKTYGAISVAVQYYCTVHQILSVPKEVFVPRPKVDSSVLRLDIRREHPVELQDERLFFLCIRAGFGQRRKTLLNSLTGAAGLSRDAVRDILERADIDPIRRSETLDLQEFAAIANSMADYIKNHQE